MQTLVTEASFHHFTEPLEGENLPDTTLTGVLHSSPFVWLQFLRHLDCIYCKGLVQDIREFIQKWGDKVKPALIFVHPNTIEEGKLFFQRFFPGAAHIADPSLRLYKLFKVRRASVLTQINPSNLLHMWKLWRRGLRNGRPKADPLLLHATFLFHEGRLIWKYYANQLNDVPDWKKLL
ncbi:MAG: hypothetical protein N2170_09665 [Bacteroidia bacterium]|nr:hypothetical protein [Bacteroidia bacterium]